MFDGLFQADTDRALAIEAESPRATPKKPPGFFTGMGTALVEGPIQGALESGRVITNVLSEYGKAAAFREGAAPAESIDKMFTTEDPNAKELGRLAKKYDPDPETSSTAAQIVHGFGKFATKVVGAVATAGPAAPLVVGVDEGVSEGLRLADKGVDAGTATLAGAARGAATAAAVALPIAGRTILQTVGLAGVGGPGAFMAEQATIREILRNADYQSQAAEYDPFDVLGLVVSTAAPLTFGAAAHLMRGRRAAPAAAPAAPPAVKPPDEVVDAARVELLNQHDMELVQGKGPEAIQAHAEGRAAAVEKIERGESPIDTGPRGMEEPTGPAKAAEDAGVIKSATEGPNVEPAPARAPVESPAGIGVVFEPVPMYRGVGPGRAARDGGDTVAGALFYSPDEAVARTYAGEGGTVVSDPIGFDNLLVAKNWMEAKDLLDIPRSASMADLIKAAGDAGHDGLTFETTNGTEFVKIAKPTRQAPAVEAETPPVRNVDEVDKELVKRTGSDDPSTQRQAIGALLSNAIRRLRALNDELDGGKPISDERRLAASTQALQHEDTIRVLTPLHERAQAKYEAADQRPPRPTLKEESPAAEGAGGASVEQDINVRAAEAVIAERGDFEIELEDGTRVSARQAMADAAAAVKQAEIDSPAFRAAVECALGAGS